MPAVTPGGHQPRTPSERTARKQKIGAQAVLVFEAFGEAEASLKDPCRELEGFIVTFDAVDKQAIKRVHQRDVEAMKLALAFESEMPSRFSLLSEGMYLTEDSGRIVYSFTPTVSAATISVSTGLTPDRASRISARYQRLQQVGDMETLQRLFTQMADTEADPLKAFLAGWAALEIFVAKSFKTYEERFLSPLKNAGQSTLRERFFQRVREVMKDKYRLTDKFVVVAAVLFPDEADHVVLHDFETFRQLKELRDSIYHGEEFSEKNLPVYELAAVLRRYVVAHVETATN